MAPRRSLKLPESLQAFASRRRDPDAKRQVILRTAVELFLERSYARTAMNDIADRLHITKPALYHYFRNKEDILLECYRWGCLLIRERLDEISAQGGTGLDRVAGFIRSYTEVITVDFGRAVIRLDDGELSPEARSEIRSYKREIDRRLRSFIQQGIGDGSIAACDPKLVSFAIAGALNWTCMWFKPGGALSGAELGRTLAHTLTNGLRISETNAHPRQSKAEAPLRLIQGKPGKRRN